MVLTPWLRWPLLGVNTLQLSFSQLRNSWGRFSKLCHVLFNLFGFRPLIDGHQWSLL